MNSDTLASALAALPKAELHLHLEGSIAPQTVVFLAARHGVEISAEEVSARYRYFDFAGFLDAYKWVTSFLRRPEDFRLIADELFDHLLRQNVIYAEITLSAGVMLRRGQDVGANFSAVRQAGERAGRQGLRVQWILDAVRQFGPGEAMETARWAVRLAPEGVVAFGIGGDELAVPASRLRPVYEFAREGGLHLLAHAGEIGGPEVVREAIDLLGVERIGHGLAVLHDPDLMDRLAASGLPLEVCPTSNLRTGALGRQLAASGATVESHPLKSFFDRGLRVTLSTDDPAMFETDLLGEYEAAARMGFSPADLARLAEMSFTSAFLPEADRRAYIDQVRRQAMGLGLL
ncbi:MAG TPA: adenosine deaminase [Candidatus Dormibacteraeota bacterium]|nr:adenosine deaminase [Candidatus Dormibacteraeota bacterium]